MMDKALKQKWTKALRSGRYKQAQGVLKMDGAYCCLGVLCNVMGAKFKLDEDWGERIVTLDGRQINSAETLSNATARRLGISMKRVDKLTNDVTETQATLTKLRTLPE